MWVRRPLMLRSPDDVQGVARGTAPETVAELQEGVEDVTDALAEFPKAIKELTDHIGRLLAEGVKMHPIEAAKEIPAAAADVANDAGGAVADTGKAAGHAVAAVPAAATDTLDTAQAAGKQAVKAGRRFSLQKRRRG